ncbi:MAG: LAGLIDADG family homing endonuclease [Candidatus Caldarchaeum sp.]
MAMAAALAQGDAAVRVKGRTMLELVLNTPYEGFAKTVANLFEGHGTISLGARKYTEDYYEWQLIIRLDLKDWQFLIEAKNSMRIPDFVKTDDELRAYLAMMLACEGHITLEEANKGRTNDTTTTFFVTVLTNTNEQLINDIEARLRELGYSVSRIVPSRAGEIHKDQYGRVYATRQDGHRLLLYTRQDVHRFLTWLGRVPHPTKEAQRVVTLRILRENAKNPIRWRHVVELRDRLQLAHEMAAEFGRRRAKQFFETVQAEVDTGRRRDTRPLKAQSAPFHQPTH